jgi:hypothetical protein
MDDHDISETARKLVIDRPSTFWTGQTESTSSLMPLASANNDATTVDIPRRTVTFDENSPEVKAQRPDQEEKKQDEDRVEPSILQRTPHHNALTRMNFGGFAEEEAPAPTMIDFGSSPDSVDDTRSPNRPSPFRPNTSERQALNHAMATPACSRNDNGDSSMSTNTSDPHDGSYASARTIGSQNSFAHGSASPVNSQSTTYQSYAEYLAFRETLRWSQRAVELEDQVKDKNEQLLVQSQAMVQKLRGDLVKQEEQAKRGVLKVFRTFQANIKSFAESFYARVDRLDDKHDWVKAALDRLVQDVEFFDRHDSVASDLSETMQSETANNLYTAGMETHMEFLQSPSAIAAVPAALPNESMEDWLAEKDLLLHELEMTKSELELERAGSESLKSMLAAKDDSTEKDELRRTNAKQLQKIAELEQTVEKRTSECREISHRLVQTQNGSCLPTQPKSAGGLLKRLSAKHKRKAPSPIKSPVLAPSKIFKDTISILRSQTAASESKQADLAASLDKVRKQCQVHQTTASKLANEVTKVTRDYCR